MIITFISLGLVVLVNILLIVSIFNFTRNNTKETSSNAVIIDISELLTLLIILLMSINIILKGIMSGPSLLFINILATVLILCIWSITRVPFIRDFLGIKIGIDSSNNRIVDNMIRNNLNNLNNLNNEIIKNSNNDDQTNVENDLEENANKCNYNSNNTIFSKYIDKNEMNNFSFEGLFPDYDKDQEILDMKKKTDKDYSAYNGYPNDHICFGCQCLKREDGYKFCGKFVEGVGTIGCSERWGCLNCKKCDQETNTKDRDYTCDNCKCYNTQTGYLCGKVDRMTGYIHKCKSSCKKCDKCYGANSDNLLGDAGMITVDPITSLNKVVRYDLKNNDLNELL